MTVAKLIEELKKYPQDATVEIDSWYDRSRGIQIFTYPSDKKVVITG